MRIERLENSKRKQERVLVYLEDGSILRITGAELLQGLLLHFRGAEAAEHVDGDGEAPETRHGGLIMLLGKHRGRNQNCRLLAVQDALHHRPQRNFGFAEADVAAQKPLHGSRRLHVVLDLRNCAQLIVGFRVFEALFKLLLPNGIRSVLKSIRMLSCCV